MYATHNAPILVGFARGSFGAKMEQMSDAEVVAAAINDLKKIFTDGSAAKHLKISGGGGSSDGGSSEGVTSFAVTRWVNDPFARGSYSGLRVGAGKSGARQALFAPCGSLFFAGEGQCT